MDVNGILQNVTNIGIKVGLQILAAIVFWIIGRWLIGLAIRFLQQALHKQHVEDTVSHYLSAAISAVLNVVLVVALLGYFGVETSTFAALLAAAGVAIGLAWGGLLANFASGVSLIVLRPFKVGDFIAAAGVTGTVQEIGLFTTVINTPDNVLTIVGNNKIFSDNIQNFSANAYRRVDLKALLDHNADQRVFTQQLKDRLAQVPNVLAEPAPDIDLMKLTSAGSLLAVRPYCHTDHYWQVYYDTNQVIRETLSAAGLPAPKQDSTSTTPPLEVRAARQGAKP